MFVLKNLDNNESDKYISYKPKFHPSFRCTNHYDEFGQPLNLLIDEIYIKPDVVAIINKFDDVYSLVNDMLEYSDSFYRAYEKFLLDYVKAKKEERMGVFFDHSIHLVTVIDELFDEMKIADSLNVKQDSTYKLNITLDEAVHIMRTSVRSRFFIPCYLGSIAVDEYQQKVIHSMLSKELIERGILNKLLQIVMSMTVVSNTRETGKKLWGFLSRAKGQTYENHVFELMTSMYYKALPSLKPNDNPIAYMISVARNELNWLLQTAISSLFLPSTIDTFSVIKPKGDLIESEIFYRVIAQKLFFPVADSYKDYRELYHYNVYNTAYNISQPLILAVFNNPIKSLQIANVHLLNFFTHQFLKSLNELPRVNMEAMLLTAPLANPEYIELDRLPDNLIEKITNTLKPYFVSKKITHLSLNTIKKYYINTVLNLYRNRFFDVITRTTVDINWFEFIEELISFTINLSIGAYTNEINNIKRTLYRY